MKYLLITALLACGVFVGCDYESYEEERTLENLTYGNKFVRLLTGGVTGMFEFVVGEEEAPGLNVNVQNLFGDGGDVTVEYSLGGTADYGEDYIIEGASASGGTLTIPFDNADPESTAPAQAPIFIELLVDTLVNGPQTIELSLVSATNSDGETVDVGQGTLRKDLTINLVND